MAFSISAHAVPATTLTVTNGTDSGSGSLRAAIATVDANPGTNYDIVFSGVSTVTLTTDPLLITSTSTVNVNTGNAATTVSIDGGHTTGTTGSQIFFAYSGTVNLANLTLQNGDAQGGAGGSSNAGAGGGLGAGGALFVGPSANVTVKAVTFTNNQATGGAGGSHIAPAGSAGGGGLGGAGGDSSGASPSGSGGGGALLGQTGGTPPNVTTGGTGGGPNGGAGGNDVPGVTGGTLSGGGGGGDNGAVTDPQAGGNGGFGGGGGGGGVAFSGISTGGNGGFGGGGGASVDVGGGQGGNGGFGGGGGGTLNGARSTGGYGGGNGSQRGGGGAALGGAIFVTQGGTLTIQNSGESGGAVTGGLGGGNGAGNGTGAGTGFFLQGSSTLGYSVTGSNSYTIGDTIASDGLDSGITKSGNGTLELDGANTFTGGVDLAAGTIAVGNDKALGTGTLTVSGTDTEITMSSGVTSVTLANAVDLLPSITYNIPNASTMIVSGDVTGGPGEGIIKKGGGELVLTGNNSYQGDTTLDKGTLAVGSNTALGTTAGTLQVAGNNTILTTYGNSAVSIANNVDLANSLTIITGGANTPDLTLTGIISDTGGLTKDGTGTLTLKGVNTYGGGTTILNGTLAVGNASALGATTSALSITSGTLDLGGFSVTVGDFSGNSGGFVTNTKSASSSQITFGTSNNEKFDGVIEDGAGTVSIVKDGSGTETLSGANTYSGGTTITNGTVVVGNNSALGATTNALSITSGTLDLNGHNGTVGDFSGNSGAFVTDNKTGNSSSFTFGTSNNEKFDGVIEDGTGTISIVKNGSGTETLSGANTYSGGTKITAGTIQVNNNSALGATTGALNITGGALDLNGHNVTVGDFSGNSGAFVTDNKAGNPSKFTFGTSNNEKFDGVIEDGTGTVSIVKDGSGTETLSGANTYSGGTKIEAGTIQVGNNSALGATTGALNITGGALDLNGHNVTVGDFSGDAGTFVTETKTGNPSKLTFGTSNDEKFSGVIEDGTGTVSIVKDGSGTETLASANTYSGGTTIEDGTIQVNDDSALGATTGSLNITGGTLDLNGHNVTVGDFSGDSGTLVTDGKAGNPSKLTFGTSNDEKFSGVIQDGAGTVSIVKDGSGTETLAGANTYSGGTTIEDGTIQVNVNSALGATTGSLDITGGALDLNGHDVTVGDFSGDSGTFVTDNKSGNPSKFTFGTGNDEKFTGVIEDGSGTVSIVKDGSGTEILAGTNTYSGGTTIEDGTIQVNDDSALGAKTGALNITGGALDLNGHKVTVGDFSGDSGTVVTNNKSGNSAKIIFGTADDEKFAGTIEDGAGTVAIVKQHSGKETLTGTNTYSGGTTISNGTLIVGNMDALGSGNVDNTGGTLRVGNGNRTINVGGEFLQGAGGNLRINLNNGGIDMMAVTGGTLSSFGGTLTINFSGYTPTPVVLGQAKLTTAYTVITTTAGYDAGRFTYDPINESTPFVSSLDYTTMPNDVLLDIVTQAGVFSVTGLTPNQTAVANNINGALNMGNTSALFLALGSAVTVNPGAEGDYLNQLTTINFAQFTSTTAFDNTSFWMQQFDNYLANHRGPNGVFVSSNGGIDSSGLTLNDPTIDTHLQMVHSRLLAWNPAPNTGLLSDSTDLIMGGVDMKDMKSCPACTGNLWNVFVAGNAILAQDFSDHTSGLSHSDATSGAVQVGADYQVSPNVIIGAMFGYGHTDADMDNIGSTASVDTYSPAVYASYASGGWYANALGSYGFSDYNQNRNVSIGAFSGTAHSAPSGDQIVGNLDGGYEFHQRGWTYGPTAGIQYVHLDVNGFTETGLPGADLTVNKDEADSLRSRLGGRVSYVWMSEGLTFTPHFAASWQHEFMDQGRGITDQFVGLGAGSFVVSTPNPSRDSALVDLGLDAKINEALTLFMDYTLQAGQSNYFGQSVQGGMKIGF